MNTIKTKIGFETKPYIIKTLYFDELFNISVKTYGRVFLLCAILLSASSWGYLRQLQSENLYQLQSLQQETTQLEAQNATLAIEYGKLASLDRLKSMAPQANMRKPSQQEVISLPSYNG